MRLLVELPAAGCWSTGVAGVPATVKGRAGVVIDTLPAASVARAVVVCAPGASGWVTGQLHAPCALATTSHTTWPSTRTVTVLPASAVPVMVGVELVTWSTVGLVMTGSGGAIESTVKGTPVDDGLVPSPVVAVAVTVCGPSVSGVVGAQTKRPVVSATAVHTGVMPPSTKTFTVEPGVAVPSKAGVASLVTALAMGEEMTGAGGGWPAATVKGVGAVSELVLPAASVAEAVTVWAPMVSGVEDAQLHAPIAFAVVVQTGVMPPSTNTCTVALGSLVPAYVGVVLVVAFIAGAVMTGTAGALVSTVNGVLFDGALVPAVVVAVATTLCGPGARAGLTSQLNAPVADAVAVHAGVIEPST